jgi:hypothetical protein
LTGKVEGDSKASSGALRDPFITLIPRNWFFGREF